MDLQSLINYVTMVAAGATVIATQILKSKLIPLKFQNYPVPTTIVVSAISTYFALASQHFVWAWHTVLQAVGTFVTVLLVAALTYNSVVSKSPAVKSTEGERTNAGL